jgi:hypothetical protein
MIPRRTTFEFEYLGEFEMEIKNILGHELGAHMRLIHEKNQRPKISCYCTFKGTTKQQIYADTVLATLKKFDKKQSCFWACLVRSGGVVRRTKKVISRWIVPLKCNSLFQVHICTSAHPILYMRRIYVHMYTIKLKIYLVFHICWYPLLVKDLFQLSR